MFAVQSLTDPDVWYSCNMYSGYCQCMGGHNCGPCVHKSGIALHFKVAMFNVLPSMDPRSRALYHLIAVGQSQDAAWYRTSEDHDEVADVDQFVEDYEAKCSSAPENLPVQCYLTFDLNTMIKLKRRLMIWRKMIVMMKKKYWSIMSM